MSMASTQREIFLRYTVILSVSKGPPVFYVVTMQTRKILPKYASYTENCLSRTSSMNHVTHSRTQLNHGQSNG